MSQILHILCSYFAEIVKCLYGFRKSHGYAHGVFRIHVLITAFSLYAALSRKKQPRVLRVVSCTGNVLTRFLHISDHFLIPAPYVGSEEARPKALASVRRSNCTCGSPACSFHEGTAGGRGRREGISEIKLTSPNWPRSRHVGKVLHPSQRHRLWWCDHSRLTTHRSSWLKSLRT
jgi:hypothetical protein